MPDAAAQAQSVGGHLVGGDRCIAGRGGELSQLASPGFGRQSSSTPSKLPGFIQPPRPCKLPCKPPCNLRTPAPTHLPHPPTLAAPLVKVSRQV